MYALVFLIGFVLDVAYYLILIYVVISLLVSFNIINLNNDFVRQIYYGINGVVEPLLAPIRRILPSTGGLDFSPLVLLLIVMFLRILILQDLLSAYR